MPSVERLRHAAVALAVVLGAGLFGLSLGGMASIDGELRAATSVPQQLEVSRMVVVHETPARPPHACGGGPERAADWRPPEV
jgi:hypothetical protein